MKLDGGAGNCSPVLVAHLLVTGIRIDHDVLEWFREQVDAAEGRKSYQGMINQALREYMVRERQDLEVTLRRVVREELANYTASQASEQDSDDPS